MWFSNSIPLLNALWFGAAFIQFVPNIADEIVNGTVNLVLNTPLGRDSFFDDRAVRRAAMMHEVPCITTLTGAAAAVQAIRALRQQGLGVRALQDYYAGIAASSM